MIPILLITGAVLGGVLLVAFWREIKEFAARALKKVRQVISAAIVGFATYIQSNGDLKSSLKAFQKFYSKNERGSWQETVVTTEISSEELPDNIKRKIEKAGHGKQIDISEEFELALEG